MPTLEVIGRTLGRIQKGTQLKLKQIDVLHERVEAMRLEDSNTLADDYVAPGRGPNPTPSSGNNSRKSTIEAPELETRTDAAVGLNSERSAKRLREALLEARPDAPRLNRSAREKLRGPQHRQLAMSTTSNLKLTQSIHEDSALPAWAKPSNPSPVRPVANANQSAGSTGASTLVRKTSDAASKVPTGSLGLSVLSSSTKPAAKAETLFGRSQSSQLNSTPPKVGPIPKSSIRRGYGLHDE